jgi:hypothetical protein
MCLSEDGNFTSKLPENPKNPIVFRFCSEGPQLTLGPYGANRVSRHTQINFMHKIMTNEKDLDPLQASLRK